MAKKEEGFRILVESPELDEELELPGNYADDRPFLQKGATYFQSATSNNRIDFVLTYETDLAKAKGINDVEEEKREREKKRQKFFANFGQKMKIETVKPNNSKMSYILIHTTFKALEEGAEELCLRMPIETKEQAHLPIESKEQARLKQEFRPWYRDALALVLRKDFFKFLDPVIEDKFVCGNEFTAPYIVKKLDYKFISRENEEKFFSSAQRSKITKHLLENIPYGDDDDEVGLTRLIDQEVFNAAFPLHDGPYKIEDEEEIENERQLLFREWSRPRNWYKYQPLENIRHYFGDKVGLYFVWLGYYTYWLLFASLFGIIIMICGLFTTSTRFNPQAQEICSKDLQEFFYMCPLCDEMCDFWYYRSSCAFSHFSQLFDYGGTVFFAAFMAVWACLFIEFWKRREAHIQYQWDTHEYEDLEEKERPVFLHFIKDKIEKHPNLGKHCKKYNVALKHFEYFQPPQFLWPKVSLAFGVVLTMAAAVLGIVFAIIMYRLAVSTAVYRTVHEITGSPTGIGILVGLSVFLLRVSSIGIMNWIYEQVAKWLTNWELHRTATEYEDSYTFKMYLFYFINFYSSIFYIAFFKGNFIGYPGKYIRIGSLRFDECPAHGCLLELTTELASIFASKLIWDDFQQLRKLYCKKLLKLLLSICRRKKKDYDNRRHWDEDLTMVPNNELVSPCKHSFFFEYLKLVTQYGFVTIFVAAFPLAPLLAWINNIIEIRLDAHKFVQVIRRPVPERSQDIGAWFYLLQFTTRLCVVTNGLLIAFTSDFIDREVYFKVYSDQPLNECLSGNGTAVENCPHGLVTWSTSPFKLTSLLQPLKGSHGETTFPILSVLKTPLYNDGNIITREALIGENIGKKENVLFLPFLNFTCLREYGFNFTNFTESEFSYYYTDADFQTLTLRTTGRKADGRVLTGTGVCFLNTTECRFRSQIEEDGGRPIKYWRTLAAKLAFVIVFENLIFIIAMLVDYIVPDVPRSIKEEMRVEKQLNLKLLAEAKAKINDTDCLALELNELK